MSASSISLKRTRKAFRREHSEMWWIVISSLFFQWSFISITKLHMNSNTLVKSQVMNRDSPTRSTILWCIIKVCLLVNLYLTTYQTVVWQSITFIILIRWTLDVAPKNNSLNITDKILNVSAMKKKVLCRLGESTKRVLSMVTGGWFKHRI